MVTHQTVADVHQGIIALIEEVATPLPWLEQIKLLCQARAGNRHARQKDMLPIYACEALGGDRNCAIPVSAAWMLYTIGGRLIDDLQDEEASELISLLLAPEAAMNVALALLPLAQVCLVQLNASPDLLRQIISEAGYMLAALAYGQQQEAKRNELPSETDYFSALLKKTGNFGATAIWAGASLGQPELVENHREHLYDYGAAVAIRAQLLDDCRDLEQDIGRGVFTLPVIYAAKNNDNAAYPMLQQMLKEARVRGDVADLMQFIYEMGGVQMTVEIAERYRIQAVDALESLPDSSAKECLLAYVSVD